MLLMRRALISGPSTPPQPTFDDRHQASLLLLHLCAAALDRPAAALGDDYLGAALRAYVDLADLVRHDRWVLLATSELRSAPLPEGAHPLPAIRGRLQEHVQVLLHPDALSERQVKAPDDGLLGQAEGERPARREVSRRRLDG